MAKSNFSPIRMPTKRPVSGKDINRVQDEISAAMKKLAGAGRAGAGITKLTSENLQITPSTGKDNGAGVDVSIASVPPGANPILLTDTAPDVLQTTSPALYLKLVIGGVTYYVPAWQKKTSSGGIPTSGLSLWVKGDAGITLSGGNIATWSDQSGHGADLTQAGSATPYDSVGFNGIPAATFSIGVDGALSNSSVAIGSSYSIFVVFRATTNAGAGGPRRLVDYNYPVDNAALRLESTLYNYAGYSTDSGSSYTPVTVTYCSLVTYASGASLNRYLNNFVTPVFTQSVPSRTGTIGVNLGGLPGFTQSADAKVVEFGIYDHDLSPTEVSDLGSYFTSRGY